jgi:two-component system sensor histidine kinase QseC
VRSIRFYLIITLLSTVTLGNFAAAVHGYRGSMRAAQALMDTQLTDTAALLIAMEPPGPKVADNTSDRLAYQIWDAGGALVMRSANSGTSPMSDFEEGYRDENFGGHRWRVLGHFDGAAKQWVLVAERIDIRIELADNIILKSVLPIVITLPIIGGIVWLVVGNGLSLIRRLASELGAKRADDLSRLQTSNPPVELAPVVDAINGLLQRLENSVERERRFSADAAHELRTPLAALKVHLHNLKRENPDSMEQLQSLESDVGRLGHLIEQIMLLYRMTPEHYQARMQRVDLHALAQSVIGELYTTVDDKQQTIALSGATQFIDGDEASLNILLSNLILNAHKYSPAGASIEVKVRPSVAGVELAVSDTGPGLPLAQIRRVFDRFYRAGGDRHASKTEGAGLGLSIVQHIASLHGARIVLNNNDDGIGLTVSVMFPSIDAHGNEEDTA